MRVSRFFVEQVLEEGSSAILEGATAHYITRVLRLGPDAALVLFNGDGSEYPGRIEALDKKQVRVRLGQAVRPQRESPLQVHLGQGISRGERMDFVLQKAVELGVHAVTPLWTGRSQVRLNGPRLDKRLQHWQGVLRSACEQSGRVRVPALASPCHLDDWCRAVDDDCRLVLDPRAGQTLAGLPPAGRVSLLIGPEGGLEEKEIDHAVDAGFRPVRLGPRILRTETAALAALTALQVLWGDLGQ